MDEKTAIRALDRNDPVLPLSPGLAERHGFEYFRHGALSLYAAFNTKTGEVLGKIAERHTSAEFVAFLTDIVIRRGRTFGSGFGRTRLWRAIQSNAVTAVGDATNSAEVCRSRGGAPSRRRYGGQFRLARPHILKNR